nr:hypothetical protein [Tanacetum cinerariifolium]
MTTVNQGMSVEEIKRVVAQRVANAIKAIAIYETKTNIALKSMSQTKRQKEKVAENASNKKKWEGNHNGSSNQKKTKGIRCLEHTLLGQSTRRHMLDLYLSATSANFTIMGRALTNNNRTRGKILAELTLQGMGRRNITADLSHYVLNATITMIVHVLPNATSATDLAI